MKSFKKYFAEKTENKSRRTVESIAKKHGVEPSDIQKQLDMGIKVEHEHTDSNAEARKIAMDHLEEVPDYYSKLKRYVESKD